jgi:predicted MFS family arabinose efflux permease
MDTRHIGAYSDTARVLRRTIIIGLIAFLTVVDLFATQAILPSLTQAYRVSPAAMSFAVNASTIGMAAAGLSVAFFSRRIGRRFGILISLCVLAIPTALLAVAPDLTTFTILRVMQGLCMASAFTLTLAYLGEECSATDAGGAFAAYITGNVASNLIGRLVSAGVADHFGLAANFCFFSALNLAGAVLVYFTIRTTMPMIPVEEASSTPFAIWSKHLRNPPLRASFGIGFCILFAFIGTFTYVNFVLVREPLFLGPMALGFVYFVFLPSIVTTPFAGAAVQRFGMRSTFWSALALAGLGLPLLLLPSLPAVVAGLMLVGVGTFFAQAAATGFVGRAAMADRGSASGIYLACYFFGGLVGTAILGQIFDRLGWPACVAGIALALATAAYLAVRLRLRAGENPV